jgi:hypothetical protein
MSEYTVSICSNDKILPLFVKANSVVTEKYSAILSERANSVANLNKCWKKEFNAQIDIDNKLIFFDSYQDMTVFLLKWS